MKFIVCAALAAMSSVAGAAVNRCVDTAGHVLYTDGDCPEGSQSVPDMVERISPDAPVPEAPRSRWANLPARKVVNVDAATLKAAYLSLQVRDDQQKLRRLASAR